MVLIQIRWLQNTEKPVLTEASQNLSARAYTRVVLAPKIGLWFYVCGGLKNRGLCVDVLYR